VCRTAALAKLDASGGGGTSVRTDFRVGGEPHRLIAAFIERAKENRFRGSFSRKALDKDSSFKLEKTRLLAAPVKRADCRSDRPFAAAPGTHAGRL
jgi:hypothetical protein